MFDLGPLIRSCSRAEAGRRVVRRLSARDREHVHKRGAAGRNCRPGVRGGVKNTASHKGPGQESDTPHANPLPFLPFLFFQTTPFCAIMSTEG